MAAILFRCIICILRGVIHVPLLYHVVPEVTWWPGAWSPEHLQPTGWRRSVGASTRVVSHLIMMCKPLGEFYLVALIYWFRCLYVGWKLGILVDPSRAANLLRPGDLYMRQRIGSDLVQAMACHLFSDKPSPEPILTIFSLNRQEQTSGIFKSKYKCFLFQQNAFENVVYKMAVVLSKPQFIIDMRVVVCEFDFFLTHLPP